MNRENLKKLADHLWGLPESYKGFGMTKYHSSAKVASGKHRCGSVACAVGHGPQAGIAPLWGEIWHHYAARVFTEDARERLWCFSGVWDSCDDTPRGAAQRIYYMLEKGLPETFVSFPSDDYPPMYADQQPVNI